LPLTESFFSLRHAWNTISVSFTYANTNIPFNTFQYRLDPIDRGWSPWSEKASVTYSRLPKGNYIFQVRTLTSNGEITPPITLSFRIKPLLIASPLAFACYAIILLAIIYFTYAYFRKKLIRKQEQMRKDTETRLLLEKQKAEQEIVKLQNENLQSEISYKNIQLANSTMALIRKNELLIGIKQELERQKTPDNSGSPRRQTEKLVSQINKNIEDDQDWKIFEELFDQAHGDFFKRLKLAYPELTQSDLKLCAYLKLNLSSKEIAPLLNISYRGVETRRYRLRKRLLLDNDANLVEFILQF
jgi:DNA-binding CsgD family transcriptional regulator